MKATQGTIGRVFVLRLEDGDEVPGCIERFAAENGVTAGCVMLNGGIGGGEIVVGPRSADERPVRPMVLPVDNAHEISAVGVLAPDTDGNPVLHIHGALGRSGQTLTGCLRPGVRTWVTGEAILYEIKGVAASRVMDSDLGFALLQTGDAPASPPPAPAQSDPAPEPKSETPAPASQPAAQTDGPRSSVLYLYNAAVN